MLIVDDDLSFLAAARRALSSGTVPFDVVTTETGSAALALLEEFADSDAPLPDFVVLDYHLPDTTAPTLLRRLSEHPVLAGLPVLVLTRDPEGRAREKALLAGASDFASKPSRVQALREIVLEFWENHASRPDDPPR